MSMCVQSWPSFKEQGYHIDKTNKLLTYLPHIHNLSAILGWHYLPCEWNYEFHGYIFESPPFLMPPPLFTENFGLSRMSIPLPSSKGGDDTIEISNYWCPLSPVRAFPTPFSSSQACPPLGLPLPPRPGKGGGLFAPTLPPPPLPCRCNPMENLVTLSLVDSLSLVFQIMIVENLTMNGATW